MKNFEELGLSPEIRRAIEEMGYERVPPIDCPDTNNGCLNWMA